MLSAFMAFIEPGDEVIIFEPFFDQSVGSGLFSHLTRARADENNHRYISNIEMPGGTIRYVPLNPPKDGAVRTSSASEWTIDFDQLEKTINPKTRMIVRGGSIHSFLRSDTKFSCRCSTLRKQWHPGHRKSRLTG
jgi:kynurenine aminotransferase